ncbi:beta-N-acetylhexosaminidase [Mariprofundus micogutta]|uniref:beta-N-acetylhexosaminidase n=1 Tax=Mariprofundus micogutta TaxID=1921010 RepID=A0A1L8CM51_9PROT|nr:beta-N-acetylhexosaminidase [Mariprofundus micogutta]GAV19965.1 beta-N-acetylhexosaminidase [Mariprofundus micogutta]
MNKHLIVGLESLQLTELERVWLKEKPPLGVILFARNIESPAQVKALLDEVRACAGNDTWAAIDEEGGRVNRIPWAPFNQRRHAAEYGEMYARNAGTAIQAVYQDSFITGEALKELGFTHNCAPVLDLFCTEGHSIIGKRSFGEDVAQVAALATACMRGLSDAGIEAVGKHFPGHGRANADSHVAVPEVRAEMNTLFDESEPFSVLIKEGLKHIMTAHVVYSAVRPEVATLSPFWVHHVLRERMHFFGRIWSDDLCMKGVGDDVVHAAKAALNVGCDALLVCEPEGVADVYHSL